MFHNRTFKVFSNLILLVVFCTGQVAAAPNNNANELKRNPFSSNLSISVNNDLSLALMTAGDTIRVSVASDGTQANSDSPQFSISEDGRYVAFSSAASNLVDGDTNGVTDVFLRDTQTNITTLIATGYDPAISANGRYVAFFSIASNLVDGDTNGLRDVFLRDTQTNTTTLISLTPYGTQWTNNDSFEPSISADGRYVTFYNTSGNIYLRDTQTNTTTHIAEGVSADISDNGRYVAFMSWDSSNLVDGDTNGVFDIFLHDIQTNTTTRISVATDGTQGNKYSSDPSISADGHYVAFMSWATNLVPGNTNIFNDVYVRDTQTNTTTRVSVATDGTQGNCNSFRPSISGDGRYVAFMSSAKGLVNGLPPGIGYLLLRDTQTNTTSLVSLVVDGLAGTPWADYGYPTAISANGHYVAFNSASGSLIPGDTNGVGDIFRAPAGSTFSDVRHAYWAWNYVERLASAGITGGCGTGIYCPDNTVTRAQMAVFLLKGMHGSSFTPPAVGASTGFTDVATDYWAAAWIKQLASEGITDGCGSGNYCPDATVTRAQMAVFLLKAKHGSSYSPSNATGVFTDVPVGYWADKWIEQLASEGITGGCGAGIYCPDSSVTRAQMAVFLVKTFDLP